MSLNEIFMLFKVTVANTYGHLCRDEFRGAKGASVPFKFFLLTVAICYCYYKQHEHSMILIIYKCQEI